MDVYPIYQGLANTNKRRAPTNVILWYILITFDYIIWRSELYPSHLQAPNQHSTIFLKKYIINKVSAEKEITKIGLYAAIN